MGRKRHHRARPTVVAYEPPPPPPVSTGLFAGNWFTRFAVAFLILFVLLWLFAPQEEPGRK